MGRLNGKIAIVLGASSPQGLGEVIARRFASEGAKVLVAGRRREPLEALAAEIAGVWACCDITDEASIADMVAQAMTTFGRLDIAVNAAGFNQPKPVADITREHLQAFADAHFIGPALFIKQCAGAMGAGASIITLSSLTVELTGPGLAGYAGAKAATDKVVEIAAVEFAAKGVRINSIAPGLVETPMTAAFFRIKTAINAFVNETPIGRMPTAQDVAAAAVWLASDECICTGDVVRVSGGQHLRRLPTSAEMFPKA